MASKTWQFTNTGKEGNDRDYFSVLYRKKVLRQILDLEEIKFSAEYLKHCSDEFLEASSYWPFHSVVRF